MGDRHRNDGQLIAASIDDPDLFGEIFRRHAETMFSFVARRVGREHAPDLTGEVFARAFTVRSRFDSSRPSAGPWLHGIALNVIKNHLRSSGVRRRRDPLGGARMAARPADPFDQADARVDAETTSDTISQALAHLRSGDRDVLLLYAVGGLSYEEVADALRIPIGTVRSRLSRARRRLEELISSETRILLLGPPQSTPKDGDR